MRELFERIRPSLRDYLYLCCSFKRYSSLTGLVHIAPHGKQQGSICHEEKVAYRPFCIYQLCGYLNFLDEKTSFKEVFEKSLAIPDYFHYLCN